MKATIDTVEKCVRADFELRDWSFSPVGEYIGNGQAYELLEMNGANDSSNSELTTRVFGQKKSSISTEAQLTGGTILTINPLKNTKWEELGYP